jgi:hypothetical protein
MTSARRCGKSFTGAPAALLGIALLCSAWAGSMAALATTSERTVANPRTGLAIEGFDPVAYFIDEAARLGNPNFELRHSGVTWRFLNPGNRAAFVDNPGDYAPRFGGYDPVGIARGAPSPGNPEFWLISEQKLYLFYGQQTREEFRSNARRILIQAEARWPDVIKVLSQ